MSQDRSGSQRKTFSYYYIFTTLKCTLSQKEMFFKSYTDVTPSRGRPLLKETFIIYLLN